MNEIMTNLNTIVEGAVRFGQMILIYAGIPTTSIVGLYGFYKIAKRITR